MTITRSSSDLQRNIGEIYGVCHKTREPVFITRNGSKDLVVMDAEAFEERLTLERALYDREMRRQASIVRGWEDALAGRLTPLEDLLAEENGDTAAL